MMLVLYSLLTTSLTLQAVNSKSVQEDELGKVIFANVLYRHGDRPPINAYPNDPYKNTSYWPVGFGQLTNTGKEQHYELGQWLRVRYDDLLTEKYNPDLIYVQSTDVDRTLMSAECNLAGMYPPTNSQIWNDNLLWQPIPVHTVPKHLNKVLGSTANCPAYEEELDKLIHSKEMQDLNDTFSEVYKVLNKFTGEGVYTLENIDFVYNTLWIEELYNFTLPAWTKDVYPHPMEEASRYSFIVETWTKKLARLKSGLLIKEMIGNMTHKKVNKSKALRNLNIYSAHDSTVANLLNAMDVYNMINPPYAACVMVELRVNSTGNHHVTIFYRNSSTEEPFLLTLPGCTPACPLDQFITLLEPVIPDDWDRECQLSFFSSYTTLIIVGLAILIILVVLLLVSGLIYWQRRRRMTYWYRKLKTDNL